MRKEVLRFCFLPPTLNEQVEAARGSSGRQKSARQKKKWTHLAAATARLHQAEPFIGMVQLDYLWLFRSQRRDPVDNVQAAAKFINDGLVLAGVIVDDNAGVIVSPCEVSWRAPQGDEFEGAPGYEPVEGEKPREGLILTITGNRN